MKQPLLSVIILLIAGIALGNSMELPIWPLLVFGLVACIAALLVQKLRAWLLPTILVFCGATSISIQRQIVSPFDLRTFDLHAEELTTIQGKVLLVRQKPALDDSRNEPARYAVWIQLNHIRLNRDGWKQAHGKVVASVEFADADRITPGQTIQLFGILSSPPGPFAPGMFDYRQHLANRGIYFLLRSEEPTDLTILKSARTPLVVGFQRWAMTALGKGFPQDDRSIELLWAMCLGWRTALTDEVAEPFMKSGTMHLFAISGLHVALIAAILIGLLRLLRISREWSGSIVIPLLWFFTASTGWQSSAIRSTIMMSVILMAWALRRPTDLLNTLSAAALIILLWDPGQLFQAGFQLSFAVVGTIAVALPWIEKWRQKIGSPDPFLPAELQPAWKQRWIDPALKFVATAFMISLAAWFGSLPLIMYYFNLFTPVSLLANILVVQLAAGALAAASGCLICASFVPFLSDTFNHSAWFLMTLMIHVSEWFSELPFAWAYTKAPPLPIIGCYYLALLVLLTPPKWIPRTPRILIVAVFGVIIASTLWSQRHAETQMTLLPLGGGQAVFVENLQAQNWLIDCGDGMSYEHRTREFLKTRGVNRIDNFFVSHGDIRHMGAGTNLITDFRPRHIYLTPLARNAGSYRKLISFIEENHMQTERIESGEEVGPWHILHPAANDHFGKSDACALVMLLKTDKETILLCSDLNPEGQQILADRHPELRANTVVISPNNDHRPIHPAWLAQFNPTTVIIADSTYPASERATEGQIARLQNDFDAVRVMSAEGVIQLFPNRAEAH